MTLQYGGQGKRHISRKGLTMAEKNLPHRKRLRIVCLLEDSSLAFESLTAATEYLRVTRNLSPLLEQTTLPKEDGAHVTELTFQQGKFKVYTRTLLSENDVRDAVNHW